jgi:single-strand DNA-binding protein
MNNKIKNSVYPLGNVGNDIILTSFDNGNKKSRVMVATSQFFNNKDGDKVKKTNWNMNIAWGKTAEDKTLHLKKGSEVFIHGKMAARSYTDMNGNTKYITERIVSDFFN